MGERYAGDRALVVGASGGIGLALAREALAGGADLALTYHSRREAVAELAGLAAERGRRCSLHRLDLRSGEEVAEVCRRVEAELGVPTMVINCAGRVRDRPLAQTAPEEWEDLVEINLTGGFRVLRALVPAMQRRGGGRILSVASLAGLFGQPGQAGYAAAKGGVIAMTRVLARELGPFGIRVNAIAPGVVETGMTDSLPDAVRRRYLHRIPLRRFGRPEDLAPVARLLLARDGYITGQVVVVDGGLSC